LAAHGVDFIDHRLGLVVIDINHDDLGAFLGKAQGRGAPNAAAGAGDNGDFVLQTHCPLLWGFLEHRRESFI
jgi:hypothetical protein